MKHFFKLVFFFTLMIALGLLSMVLIANLDKSATEMVNPETDILAVPCEEGAEDC